jgi:hypothetical protein
MIFYSFYTEKRPNDIHLAPGTNSIDSSVQLGNNWLNCVQYED